eukprot:GFUD01011374.1.p1 GENE.GFUD01011374.1~~GFUD01011374.1.p1  ORF type:complete len:247 (+),score=49.68 GFUD01011374.1:116-856(+)
MPIVKTDVTLPENRNSFAPLLNQKKLAFVLDHVLSEEECEALIEETSEKGYEPALLNVGGGAQVLATDVRNSERCIIDSKEKALWIWEKIKDYIPETWHNHQVVGLNERLRFLRYSPGEYFKPHMDGVYMRPDKSERSFITIQLYLNGGFEGGNTTFISNRYEDQDVGVVPKPGRILVFQHDILHEGSVLETGTKYTMRTDIMYNIMEVGDKASAHLPNNMEESVVLPNADSKSKSLKRNNLCISQ